MFSQVLDNKSQKDERRLSKEDLDQVVTEIQDGDTKNAIRNYQGTTRKNHFTETYRFDFSGVMGKPGVDFPVLTYIPRTSFTCRGMKSGYYADLDTNCQV